MAAKNGHEAAIYLALADDLAEEIRYGVYTPGGRLPSIRDMAAKKQVSHATMQRAYQTLERQGMIRRFSTWGYFRAVDKARYFWKTRAPSSRKGKKIAPMGVIPGT